METSLKLSSKTELANHTLGKVKEIINVLSNYFSNLEVVDCYYKVLFNRPFPNYLWPPFQSESWCSYISSHSHANKD